MARFAKKYKNSSGHDSDSVSDLSHDDQSILSSASNISKSSTYLRSKIGRLRKKKSPNNDGTASVGSRSRSSRQGRGGTSSNTRKAKYRGAADPGSASRSVDAKSQSRTKARPPGGSVGGGSVRSSGGNSTKAQTDKKRLVKDAKSRFNIGLVYLKTGDYAKAQDNLEHSLFCHIQLFGHDAKAYTNETLFAIAGVREKLGDCYVANTVVDDKVLALDHYEESRRLLKSVHREDASDNIVSMLVRVEEKLKQPELQNAGGARKAPSRNQYSSKYEQGGNSKAMSTLGLRAATGAVHPKIHSAPSDGSVKSKGSRGINRKIEKRIGKIQDAAHNVKVKIKDGFDDCSHCSSDSASHKSFLSKDEGDWFETAMAHLERDNHRTALNFLTSQLEGGSMKNDKFRAAMARSMIKVANSAMEGGKISVATDAYEEAVAVLKQDENPGKEFKLAVIGCVKGHKKLAIEMEDIKDYGSAIQHRSRVYQLLDEDNRTVPACEQKVKIAYLYGALEEYMKSTTELSDTIRRLFRGVASQDLMPTERSDLLIQCYQMRAICYAKTEKWTDALQEYDLLLPLISRKEGVGGRDYNSAVIHKSALLVTMGKYSLAASTIDTYLQLQGFTQEVAGNLIVDDLDHVLALDVFAATQLKLGNMDVAISTFESKLQFVQTLPNNNKMKSDTLHKLGCLHANSDHPQEALPLLNQALSTKKFTYDGKHKSLLETTWAVAATNHTLGNNESAVKEYSALLEQMESVDDMPLDSHLIYNSAGRLFLEDGKMDKAIDSFRQALDGVTALGNSDLKAQVMLNLANALSAKGETDKAMELYTVILQTKALKKTKIFFLARFNQSLLRIKTGEVEEGKSILRKIAAASTSAANDVKGSIYLTLGNLTLMDGNTDEALSYFEKSLNAAPDDDFNAHAQAKRCTAMAYLAAGDAEEAIVTLEDVLEDISNSGAEGKSVDLLKAKIWNSMARVYKKQQVLPEAIDFSKLALQTYKAEMGETNPITLRNVSNLQLLLLEHAEDLEPSKAKPIIDAAKSELETTLAAFVALNDPWTHRLDIVSLKTNLGFVAVWQGKPKKARKLICQIEEIELSPEDPLVQRVTVLEERVKDLEKEKAKR